MKKLLVLLMLCCRCFAQQLPASVTVTGTIQTATGGLATSGTVEFDLVPQNSSISYTVVGGTAIVPQKGICNINVTGNLVDSVTGTNPCLVWGNDQINPQNSLYNIIISPNGQLGASLKNVYISGTTVDLSSLTFVQPQPVIGTAINASPLVTQSVVPALPGAWQIGQSTAPYANIFTNTTTYSGPGPLKVQSPFGNTPILPPAGWSAYSFDINGNPVFSINGGAYQPLVFGAGAGVQSFNARTGNVVSQVGDYSNFYVNLTPTAPQTITGGFPLVLTGPLQFKGATSGTVNIVAQSAAGTPSLVLPTTSGTFMSNVTLPLALNGTTGNVSCPTCSTSVFQVNGVALTSQTPVNFQNSAAFNGLTFTFSNPSAGNVQLGATGTLGNAGLTNSSVTINNPSGVLGGGGSVSLGGTLNFAWSGTSGGIPYFSNATTMAGTAALTAHDVVVGEGAGNAPSSTSTGTAGQVLTSNGSGADPTFQAAAGGALVQLESHTASNSAELDFTTCITSSYHTFIFELNEVVPATNAVAMNWQASTNGGSTYDTGTNYHWASWRASNSGQSNAGASSDTRVDLAGNGTVSNSTNTGGGFSGSIRINNPLGAANWTKITGTTTTYDGTSVIVGIVSGAYKSTTAVNAFRILASSGNLTSGVVTCYGLTP